MPKESFEFFDLFSSIGKDFEDRKQRIERSNKMKFEEKFHTEGRAEWIVDLYLELDHFITSLKTGIRKEFLESYIKYSFNGLLFCYIILRKGETLRLWAKIPYASLGTVPLFVRDYKPISRRSGVMVTLDDQREFVEGKEAILGVVIEIVKKALKSVASRKVRKKTPLEAIKKRELEPVKPTEEFRPSLNLLVNSNGYIEVNFRIKKDQRELLNRILQETILK